MVIVITDGIIYGTRICPRSKSTVACNNYSLWQRQNHMQKRGNQAINGIHHQHITSMPTQAGAASTVLGLVRVFMPS